VPWRRDEERLTIESLGYRFWQPPEEPIDCGNSATTIRLLAGALAAAGSAAVLDGSEGLRKRPMDRVLEPLRMMGVPIHGAEGDRAPLTLKGHPSEVRLLNPVIRLSVASAQVKTAVLVAGFSAEGPLEVHEPSLSRDHTERMLREMGVAVQTTIAPGGEAVHRLTPPRGPLPPLRITVPGDMSSAAFLIVAALTTPGSELELKGVGLNPGRTGLLEALQEMGADVRIENRHDMGGEPVGDLTVRHSALKGIRISGERVVRMIDEFPIFAVAAAHAEGATEVREARELRFKESDRIAALRNELTPLGIPMIEFDDGFAIEGGRPIRGGFANARGDHRLAMSLAVAGLSSTEPVVIDGAEMVAESFPGFFDVLAQAGARVVT
jgi:3-phosphoshikimate 1-carboxyvinyltransferase